MSQVSAGARFRTAIREESPLQVMGAITAYAGLMAKRTGYKALYLSGGGVAAFQGVAPFAQRRLAGESGLDFVDTVELLRGGALDDFELDAGIEAARREIV